LNILASCEGYDDCLTATGHGKSRFQRDIAANSLTTTRTIRRYGGSAEFNFDAFRPQIPPDDPPTVLIPAIQTMIIKLKTTQYSTAVDPSSPRRNFRKVFMNAPERGGD
jgi:hypothetical protein